MGPGASCASGELAGIRGGPGQFNVDLTADVQQSAGPHVGAVGAIDEGLEFNVADAITHFPDAEGRPFKTCGVEAMVVEASFKIAGHGVVPATTGSQGLLNGLKPFL